MSTLQRDQLNGLSKKGPVEWDFKEGIIQMGSHKNGPVEWPLYKGTS